MNEYYDRYITNLQMIQNERLTSVDQVWNSIIDGDATISQVIKVGQRLSWFRDRFISLVHEPAQPGVLVPHVQEDPKYWEEILQTKCTLRETIETGKCHVWFRARVILAMSRKS